MQALELFENLRDKFDLLPEDKKLGLTFIEYHMLFRIKEGVKFTNLYIVLHCSSVTIYRLRKSIIKKLSAKTFEQALLKAGELKCI